MGSKNYPSGQEEIHLEFCNTKGELHYVHYEGLLEQSLQEESHFLQVLLLISR